MSLHPETVRVKADITPENDQGFIVINKEDFVEGEHESYDEETKEAVPPVPQPQGTGQANAQESTPDPGAPETPVLPWAK